MRKASNPDRRSTVTDKTLFASEAERTVETARLNDLARTAPKTVTFEASTTYTTKSGTISAAENWGSNARIQRGRGRLPLDRVPYVNELAVKALKAFAERIDGQAAVDAGAAAAIVAAIRAHAAVSDIAHFGCWALASIAGEASTPTRSRGSCRARIRVHRVPGPTVRGHRRRPARCRA